MNGTERVCFFKLAGVCIEAYENGQAVGHAGAINHIALDVDDVCAAAKGYEYLAELQLGGKG